MRRKRYLYILLAAALLAQGCSRRTVPLPVQGEPEPLGLTAETSLPTPPPTPTPSPEPTPCPHPSWTEGVCDECGAVCAHEEHDPETRRCLVCGQVQRHEFVRGVCRCGASPVFEEWDIPEALRGPCPEQGTLEKITYTTWRYNGDERQPGTETEKEMTVYLPYGYDPEEQYDVLILLHGLGQMEDYWLAEEHEYGEWSAKLIRTTDVLDNLIYTGYCGKMIVAAPTFYRNGYHILTYDPQWDGRLFWTELRYDILPCLAENYATYARSGEAEDIAAVREHFGYVGLSMGSVIAFQSVLPHCLDLIGWIGCLSGFGFDPYVLGRELCAGDMAEYPIYWLYNGCGTADVSWQEHKQGYGQLLASCRQQVEGRLVEGENTCFVEIMYAKHEFKGWIVGLYNCLQVFFSLPGS